ncbi:hypothetical protein ACP3WI_25275, partial [Salmonella enterica]|uniref:hypothetical protein n=1 Tax=Salmonella enterica TaxID=28901 RepID=UPI003CF517A1
NLPQQLEAAQVPALLISVFLQGFYQRCVFTVTQRFGIKTEVNVHRTHVRHIVISQQQPRNRTADDGEFAF